MKIKRIFEKYELELTYAEYGYILGALENFLEYQGEEKFPQTTRVFKEMKEQA